MSIVGSVDSLWRYPVKSMRGEELREAVVGFAASMAIGSSPSPVPPAPKDSPGSQGVSSGRCCATGPAFGSPRGR